MRRAPQLTLSQFLLLEKDLFWMNNILFLFNLDNVMILANDYVMGKYKIWYFVWLSRSKLMPMNGFWGFN